MKIKIWQNEYGIVGFSRDKTSVKYFKNVIFFNLMILFKKRNGIQKKRVQSKKVQTQPTLNDEIN